MVINTIDVAISTIFSILLKFLDAIYTAGTIKNNSIYQIGLSINRFTCMELASTAALSPADMNKPTAKSHI
ncbi:hypothetical protein CSC2_44450 [Clostridium zeae]|uniref:Uncharacterized protein n=1 Tax=Clostridium zeae TaxID=2759022 RepID=A0ABQ1EGG2_9CLOT|nr:hypothetical protein CSC2_44450 [Clostridium zeae]